MTTLRSALDALTPENTVHEMKYYLLGNAEVSLSCAGRRVVSVSGYDGTVTIDNFARKYLKAKEFQSHLFHSSFKERLSCYKLWDEIKNLYTESDRQVENSCCFFRSCAKIHDRAWDEYPQAIFGDNDEFRHIRERVFEFTQPRFEELFGIEKNTGISTRYDDTGKKIIMWRANLEQVNEAARAHGWRVRQALKADGQSSLYWGGSK